MVLVRSVPSRPAESLACQQNHWPKTLSGWWFEPIWKIWKSVGMIIPNNYGKIIQIFQTTNQLSLHQRKRTDWPKKTTGIQNMLEPELWIEPLTWQHSSLYTYINIYIYIIIIYIYMYIYRHINMNQWMSQACKVSLLNMAFNDFAESSWVKPKARRPDLLPVSAC